MTRPGIVHITTYLQGGAGRAICDLALGQHRAGRPVTVVTSRTPAPGYGNYPEYVTRLRGSGVRLLQIDSTFTRDFAANLAVVRTLRDVLDLGTIGVIHAHAGTPALIALVLASRAPQRIPVIQTMHGWGTNKSPEQASRDLALMRELDAVVTTSVTSARWLASQGIADRLLETIPCGLDPEVPSGGAARPFADVAAAHEAGAAIVACIGSVTAQKNQALLVDAMPRLIPQLDRPVVAVFVGEGAIIPHLQTRAADLGIGDQCWFVGYRTEAAAVLGMADALVLPSRGEGQGLAVLEAFRANVPAVVSDTPALLELVQDGMTGYVFQSESADALAERLAHVLRAKQQEIDVITAQAHARFMVRFTSDAMQAAHAALYERVAARSRPTLTLTVPQAYRAAS